MIRKGFRQGGILLSWNAFAAGKEPNGVVKGPEEEKGWMGLVVPEGTVAAAMPKASLRTWRW
jgi:hypothetical protein